MNEYTKERIKCEKTKEKDWRTKRKRKNGEQNERERMANKAKEKDWQTKRKRKTKR